MDDPIDHDENVLVKLTSLVVLGAGLLALFLGFEWFWLVFALGFAVLVPMMKVVADEFGIDVDADEADRTDDEREVPDSKQDALDTLRDRYARGELTDAQFERKVERLLETETLEGAHEHVDRETTTARRETEMRETERSDRPDEAATRDRDRETEPTER